VLTSRSARQPVIVVDVGRGPRALLSIHENVLRASSRVLHAAVDDVWPRMKTELPEEDPDIFASYVDWLYTKDSTLCDHDKVLSAVDKWDLLIHSYSVGLRLWDPPFRDTVVDQMKRLLEDRYSAPEFVPTPTIMEKANAVYKSTLRSSKRRTLFAEYVAGLVDPVTFATAKDTSSDLIFDVAKLLMQKRFTGDADDLYHLYKHADDRCYYHEHKKDSELCYLLRESK